MAVPVKTLMTPGRWVGAIVVLGVVDLLMDRTQGVTLSQTTRDLYRVQTPVGKVALIASWSGLTVWLIPHLLKRIGTNT